MNAPEFDEFSRLWQGEEDAEEQRVFRRLAWRVGLKARALQFADYGLAALVIGAVMVGMLSEATPATLLFGALLGTAAVWATWKRRMLHHGEMVSGANDRGALIGMARERCRVELRQANSGLLLFPLGLLLAALFKLSVLSEGRLGRFPDLFVQTFGTGDRLPLPLVVLVIAEIYFLYRGRLLRRELKRLDALLELYRREAYLDARGEAPAAF